MHNSKTNWEVNVGTHTDLTFGNLKVGEKFVFNNKVFKKVSDLGMYIGFMNAEDDEGNRSHMEFHFNVGYLN